MNGARALVIAASVLVVHGPVASAQDLSRYRLYGLESSLASVITASGAAAADAKTLHERPARIQTLEWRAPYVARGSDQSDPVRQVTFSFLNDALYQVVVNYDRERTEGLTDRDLIESLTSTYGTPVAPRLRTRPVVAIPESVTVERWESDTSSVTLVRNVYSREFQLVLISKPLSTRARDAIREAVRLDGIEAPRREKERREKEIADETAARDKARTTNKAAFRP